MGEILDFYTKCILHMAYNMPGVNALKVDSHFYTKSANYALIIAACRRLVLIGAWELLEQAQTYQGNLEIAIGGSINCEFRG